MTLEEFNAKLRELDKHIAGVLQWFEDDTGVTVGSLLVERADDGDYHVYTGLDFPEEEAQ